MAFTRDLFGRLDILDNNAAYHGDVNDGDVLSMTVELWENIMSVNARGAMLMCKNALPLMIAQGGRSLLDISSGTAQGVGFYSTASAARKGATNPVSKSAPPTSDRSSVGLGTSVSIRVEIDVS